MKTLYFLATELIARTEKKLRAFALSLSVMGILPLGGRGRGWAC